MGFDFGLMRIGIAVGSLDSGRAQVLTTLKASNGDPDWNRLGKLITAWRPTVLVVGRPDAENSGGTDGANNPATRQLGDKLQRFCTLLGERFGLPIKLVNEAYTSVEARRLLSEQRRAGRGKKLRKGDIDMTAAVLILEQWLSQENTAKKPHDKQAN